MIVAFHFMKRRLITAVLVECIESVESLNMAVANKFLFVITNFRFQRSKINNHQMDSLSNEKIMFRHIRSRIQNRNIQFSCNVSS